MVDPNQPGPPRVLHLVLVAGALLGCTPESAPPVVAEAAGYQLGANEAARLLVTPDLPLSLESVQERAEAWIDYTLMAEAVSRSPSLEGVDLWPVTARRLEPRLMDAVAARLRLSPDEGDEAFLARMEAETGLRMHDSVEVILRGELARDPGWTGSRPGLPLALFHGGEYTVAEALTYAAIREPGFESRLFQAPPEVLVDLVWSMARGKALLARAGELGLEVPGTEVAAAQEAVRSELLAALDQLGLRVPASPGSSAPDPELATAVLKALVPFSPELRALHFRPFTRPLEAKAAVALHPEAFPLVLERARELRAEAGGDSES